MNKEFWNKKKVLITGDKGFIGTALTKALKDAGATISGFDLKNKQDIRDVATVDKEIRGFAPDIVFHLAAITQVTDAEKDIAATYATNIGGTLNVCAICMELNIPIIVASSDKVYGNTGRSWAYENATLYGYSGGIYSRSKVAMDELVRDLCGKGLQGVITRSANVYGFGDKNDKRLIPGLLNSLSGKEKFKLRTHGRQVRTYIHIDDAVGAYVAVAEAFLNRKVNTGTIFNFSNKETWTAEEICMSAARAFGLPADHFLSDSAQDDNGELPMQYVAERNLTVFTGYQFTMDMETFWYDAVQKIKPPKGA